MVLWRSQARSKPGFHGRVRFLIISRNLHFVDIAILENWSSKQADVVSSTAYIGQGAARFIVTYQAGDPIPSYGHDIVRTSTIDEIAPLIVAVEVNLPQGEFRAKRLAFGLGGGDPIQMRFSGPNADGSGELSSQAIARLSAAADKTIAPRIDWREMEQVLRLVYATERAQEAGITHDEITSVLRFATVGKDFRRNGGSEPDMLIELQCPK